MHLRLGAEMLRVQDFFQEAPRSPLLREGFRLHILEILRLPELLGGGHSLGPPRALDLASIFENLRAFSGNEEGLSRTPGSGLSAWATVGELSTRRLSCETEQEQETKGEDIHPVPLPLILAEPPIVPPALLATKQEPTGQA